MGIDPETINSKKVGWILKRLRLKKVGRENGKGAWMWGVKMADIEKWRRAYSLIDQKHEGGQKQNGENGENGEMAEKSDLRLSLKLFETLIRSLRIVNFLLDLFPCPSCRPDSQSLKLRQWKLLLCGDEQEQDQYRLWKVPAVQVFTKEETVM